MDPLVLEFLGVLVRWLLTAGGAWLVTHHVLTADQSDQYVTAVAKHLAVALPMLAGLAWGLWVRYRGRKQLLVSLSHGLTTEDAVNAILKSGAPTPTVTTPTNSIPGVPR